VPTNRNAESLSSFLEHARARVDEALERYLPAPPACPALLSEAIRYSVFAGGKRLRPLLTLAAADAFERREKPPRRSDRRAFDAAMPAACAIELIHTYSLIHDDLPAMDNDTLRRGRPTLHVVYGDGIAILAGDALLTEAFTLLVRSPDFDAQGLPERKLWALSVVANAAGAVGMVGGQAIDLQAAGQVPGHELVIDPDGLRDMHARKTGALIAASATVGAIMAGAGHSLSAAVTEYGKEIGLAFQIVDDILDVEGTADQLGKTAGKDAAGEKPTYPSYFGLERSRKMAAEAADRARAVLEKNDLIDSWLPQIADWIITRRT
jgi:geranylgeranyl diphosphate synthase type II